jgi:hypothetical protein
VLQPEYNLCDRAAFDGALRDLCIREGVGVVTYFSLASGFLSGKYRSESDLRRSVRGEAVAKYFDVRGARILRALDEVSLRNTAEPAEVALAWLMAREGVTAPIASATSREQGTGQAGSGLCRLSDGPTLAAMFRAQARAVKVLEKDPTPYIHYSIAETGGLLQSHEFQTWRLLHAAPQPYTRERFDDTYNWTVNWNRVVPGATYETVVDNRAWK